MVLVTYVLVDNVLIHQTSINVTEEIVQVNYLDNSNTFCHIDLPFRCILLLL